MERKCNFTYLVLAVRYSRYGNDFNMIRENIEFEDINLKDGCGSCTLETVELILTSKSDINVKSNIEFTASHICFYCINSSSNIETIKLLLECNADVNLVDYYGETQLFKLVKNKNLKAIKLLLKYGVKINIKDFKNKSAIDISIERYKFNSEIKQMLLTFDKNIDYKFSNYLDLNFIYKN
jgi:ankyrin repeat protein